VTSAFVDKTAVTIGQVLFLAVGLAVALASAELSAEFRWAMAILLGVQIAAVAGFVAVQCVGLGGRTLRLLRRLGVPQDGTRARAVLGIDDALAAAYRQRWTRVVASAAVHLAAWIVGSVEVYLVLRWLDAGTSFSTALAVDAVGTGIRFLAFAVPGALGVLEGGYMLAFAVFGLGSGLGLSFSLVRRLRLIVWSAAGLLVAATRR
jgi:hypothetical protein